MISPCLSFTSIRPRPYIASKPLRFASAEDNGDSFFSHSPYQRLQRFIDDRFGGNIERLIQQTVRVGNYLGEGEESVAYALSDQYVLLKAKNLDEWQKELKSVDIPLPDENIGQTIAIVPGADSGSPAFSFVLRQDGYRLKEYRPGLLFDKRYTSSEGTSHQEYVKDPKVTRPLYSEYKEFLSEVNRVDLEGYIKFAELLNKVRKTNGLAFDPDPTNILVDSKNNRFNLIDCQNDFPKARSCENLHGMLRTLLNAKLVGIDSIAVHYAEGVHARSLANDPGLIEKRREIFKKCIIAAYKAKLPVIEMTRNNGHTNEYPWLYEEFLCSISGLEGKWKNIYQLLTKKWSSEEKFFQELDRIFHVPIWELSDADRALLDQQRENRILACAGVMPGHPAWEIV